MKKLTLLFVVALVFASCQTNSARNYGSEVTSVRHAKPFEKIEVKGADKNINFFYKKRQ